jgi:hypothetical protein
VIQHKIGEMARQCESLHAWLENITFQMNSMSKAGTCTSPLLNST